MEETVIFIPCEILIGRRWIARQFDNGRCVAIVPTKGSAKESEFAPDGAVTNAILTARGDIFPAERTVDLIWAKGAEVWFEALPCPFRALRAFVSQVSLEDASNVPLRKVELALVIV